MFAVFEVIFFDVLLHLVRDIVIQINVSNGYDERYNCGEVCIVEVDEVSWK